MHEDNAPFGGRVTDIVTQGFKCVVTTAKEGFFSGLSTMVVEVSSAGVPRPCAKLIYTRAARKADRQAFHTVVAAGIDAAGEDGASLRDGIAFMVTELKERGVLAEFINLA